MESSSPTHMKLTMNNIKKINAFVSVLLVVFYIYFFGYNSVKRYLKKAVITTTLEEDDSPIIPPSKISLLKENINSWNIRMCIFRHNC